MSGRAEKLLGNTLIFAISNFASKILVFLMLPLYTTCLTAAEYGVADLLISIVTLSLPLFTFAIDDGVLRYVMDKDYDKCDVFILGMQIVTGGLILFGCVVFTLRGIEFIGDNIFFLFLISIPNYYFSLFSKAARGLNEVKKIGIAGVISTVSMVVTNIIGLVVCHWGLSAYLLSFSVMYGFSSIYLFVSARLYRYLPIARLKKFNRSLALDVMHYSIPLIPNKVSWWVVDTSNKYVVNFFSGSSVTGLYSAALKIPTILNTVQSIFSQAWTLSAISENDAEDRDSFYIRYHDYFNAVLFTSCAALMIVVHPLGLFLYSQTFEAAIALVPGLLISSVFGGSAGFMSALFSARKQTKCLFASTICGAAASLCLALVFVPMFGGYGAVLANIGAYLTIFSILLVETFRVLRIQLRVKTYFVSLIPVLMQAYINICFGSTPQAYLLNFFLLLAVLLLWRRELCSIVLFCKRIILNKCGKQN